MTLMREKMLILAGMAGVAFGLYGFADMVVTKIF